MVILQGPLLQVEVSKIIVHVSGKSCALPPLPIQFADYVLWKLNALDAILKLHLPYWKAHLAGAPSLRFPLDRPARAAATLQGQIYRFELSPELTANLLDFGHREKLTSFMILFSAFQVLLSVRTRQDDVVVGVVGARAMSELRDVMGFCANYAPVRTDLSGDPTIRQMLGRVRDTAIEAHEHYYPHIEHLPEILRVEQPFCRIQFHFNASSVPLTFAAGRVDFGGELRAEDFDVQPMFCPAHNDLTLVLVDEQARVAGHAIYRTDLLDRGSVDQFIDDYKRVLVAIVKAPDRRLLSLAQEIAQSP